MLFYFFFQFQLLFLIQKKSTFFNFKQNTKNLFKKIFPQLPGSFLQLISFTYIFNIFLLIIFYFFLITFSIFFFFNQNFSWLSRSDACQRLMLILIAENNLNQSKSSNIFNQILSVFSSASCFCVRNFQTFFFCGTLQIRWRQLSWVSMAVREIWLKNS